MATETAGTGCCAPPAWRHHPPLPDETWSSVQRRRTDDDAGTADRRAQKPAERRSVAPRSEPAANCEDQPAPGRNRTPAIHTSQKRRNVDTLGRTHGRPNIPRAYPRGIKGFISTKLPKLDLTTDAKYVANLVNVNTWLQTCNTAWACYVCITTFFLLISHL